VTTNNIRRTATKTPDFFPVPFLEASKKACGKIERLVKQPQTLELRRMSAFCT